MLPFRNPAPALALGLVLGLGGPAAALPVSVYADGTTESGFDPADVAAAIAAGAGEPTVVGEFVNSSFFDITTPHGITGVKGKNKLNPSKGFSTWTLHVAPQTPEALLESFALVILGHDLNDPIGKYKTGNVGLVIDTQEPLQFVRPAGDNSVYVAFLLGDLEPGESYSVPIEYLLGQKLKKAKNEFGEKVLMFPRYSYALVQVDIVPEPSVLGMMLVGAGALALARRRAR
jgi:hypothetical protein